MKKNLTNARIIRRLLCCAGLGLTPLAQAHHGVASLGATGLEGPGAPLETSSSATLPAGAVLTSFKVDQPKYRRYTTSKDGEADYNVFTLAGIGYGITPSLSAYVFLPYTQKVNEAGGFNTRGPGDLSLSAVLGFKYDAGGLQLTPANESLDDLEEWHFTAYASITTPTGRADIKSSQGISDPGQATGFGQPSFTLGATATQMLTQRLTTTLEAAVTRFQPHHYTRNEQGESFNFRFGTEKRANAALSYRLHTDTERQLRTDANLELNYLGLARDNTQGMGDRATGGRIVYLVPGLRVSINRFSFAVGIKKPVWKKLNESGQQQGSEGKEKYRAIFSASMLF